MTVINRLFTVNRAIKAPGTSWLCPGCRHFKDSQCVKPEAELIESGTPEAGAAVCSHYRKNRGKSHD